MARTPKRFRRKAKREAPVSCRHRGVAEVARDFMAGGFLWRCTGDIREVMVMIKSVTPIYIEEPEDGPAA